MISTIMVTVGYLDTQESEDKIIGDLQRKIRYVSDERKDPLKKINGAAGGKAALEWNVYVGSAERLDADALIKYFMDIKLYANYHMQLFVSREGATNFECYWNGGGDAQTQFRGNANWRRGK
jgi:alpha-L-arabinofuranosidase